MVFGLYLRQIVNYDYLVMLDRAIITTPVYLNLLPIANDVWDKVIISQVLLFCPRGRGLADPLKAEPPPGRRPPPRDTWDTTGYGQQGGSTHPTGMHSYVSYDVNNQIHCFVSWMTSQFLKSVRQIDRKN